jgi:hypothetical protein
MAIIDHNGRPVSVQRNPPMPKSPDAEMLRILRLVETAYRTGTAELCAQLDECFKAGWSLTDTADLEADKVEITIIMHMWRDADGKLRQRPERWIRMGKNYHQALAIMKGAKGQ